MKKKITRNRLIAIVVVFALAIALVQIPKPQSTAGVVHAEEEGTGPFRKVVYNLKELPQYEKDYQQLQYGTPDRPFVVLEIVPYLEYAEFGYLISGCEPIDMTTMHWDKGTSTVKSLGNAFVEETEAYLFPDEIVEGGENDPKFWSDHSQNPINGKVYGYFQLVPVGQGNFHYEDPTVSGNVGYSTVTSGNVLPIPTPSLGVNSSSSLTSTSAEEAGIEENVNNSQNPGEIEAPTETEAPNDTTTPSGTTDTNVTETQTTESGTLQFDDGEGPSTDSASIGSRLSLVSDIGESVVTGQSSVTGNDIPDSTDSPDLDDESNNENETDTSNDNLLSDDLLFDNSLEVEIQTSEEDMGEYEISLLALDIELITPAENGNGNLIWHSFNKYEFEHLDYSIAKYESFNGHFSEDYAEAADYLQNLGDRFYTYRLSTSGDDQAMCIYNYFIYENYDYFLTQSLNLSSAEAAANYSIVVKTITPDDLNKEPEWVDYADLIVLSPKPHVDDLPTLWVEHNADQVPSGYGAHTKESGYHAFEDHDLDGSIVLRIYNKVTADSNYAAIIIDDNIYNTNMEYSAVTDKSKRNVNINVHDWNMRDSGLDYNFDGYNNNIYKLCLMLLAMDSNLFKQLYLNGDGSIIQINAAGDLIVTNQIDDAAVYWGVQTFLLAKPGIDLSQYGNSLYGYWTSDELWYNYHSTIGISDEVNKFWVNEHVFTYNGSSSLAMQYVKDEIRSGKEGSKFHDFYDYLTDEEKGHAHPAEAIRYILDAGKNNGSFGQGMNLNILDLEPSVGLNSDGTPDWYLTPTYIRMLLPNFDGNVTISHQTTAEFIGKAEDLNAKYQMIFMGLDYSAYNTSNQSYQRDNGSWTSANLPDWNDDSLDGLIYLHTGDKMYSTDYVASSRTRSVNWLWGAKLGVDSGDALVNQLLRFPGNDISLLKKADLEEFLAAGYPVVMESNLFNLEKKLIDQNSYVYAFVNESKNAGKTVYNVSTATAIENAVRNVIGASVTFTTLPKLYNGATADGSAAITNPNYLDTDSGRPYLPFGFNVSEEGYSYRIYVDSNRNSKFEDDEVILNLSADVGANYYAYRMPSSWVGLVQWKIEVYKTSNPAIRYAQSGCSAVRNTSGTRKEVRVLQIMPKEIGASGYNGSLNLEQSNLFRTYYKDLVDYDIKITTITWDEYSGYFEDSEFAYNYMEDADDINNPNNLDQVGGDLANYHMIIMGFGDTYGGVNLSNANGEVDYLRYFLDQGKSILFTHDLTSLYNLPYNGNQIFGYTVNASMRDLMGMNRYRAISDQLNAVERERLRAYQAEHASDYDTTNSVALHGYTYYSLKRLGFTNNSTNPNDTYQYKVPYKYMITNPAGSQVVQGNSSGFNNNNDLTTRASKVNEGQITVYPYLIDDTLPISPTHGQWYQLAPEDAEVTVWYALTGDDAVNATDRGNDGSTVTYAVSPNDTMNNYYIYSKGNIFYSGVGHSTVDGVMEAKLFINTMIAAYNSGYEPPVIEIVNDEAVLQGAQQYSIEIMQNFDELVSDYYGSNINYTDETYPVDFTPVDFNLVSTQLECTIQLADGIYIDQIQTKVNGATVTLNADAEHKFVGINNGQVYTLQYPMKYLYDWTDAAGVTHTEMRAITFSIKNNRVKASNSTILNMSLQPLFPLD